MKITWFGHSAFRVEFAKTVMMIDPFLSGNPVFDGVVMEAAKGATHVALTHGHDDHIGDTVDICKVTDAPVLAVFELALHMGSKGVENVDPMGAGGSLYYDDFIISLVRADHSSSSEGVYLGNAGGLIIKARESGKVLYHMGDTDIFGDMALINEIHQPDIGIVPIGDRFTMNPKSAALACTRYFDFKTIIPCHYDTFPLLTGKADDFAAALGLQADRLSVLTVGGSLEC